MSEFRNLTRAGGFELNRRRFLRLASGVGSAAFTLSLGAACGPGAPTASPTRPTTAPTGSAASANGVYPTYLPSSSGPKPDVPAAGQGYDDSFDTFPSNPAKAMGADPPGTGGTVHIMSIALFPPPTPLA
jgi:hypothetical protein